MILVPYTTLYTDTIEALPDAFFVRVKGEHGYRLLLAEMWRRGQPFTLVEHDVAPRLGQIEQLEDCSEPWCHYGYCPGDWTPTFGCVRFSAELIAGTPGIFEDESWPWGQLDAKFQVEARRLGWEPHWHYPHVLHTRFAYLDEQGTHHRVRLGREMEMYLLTAETEMIRAELT